MLNKWCNYFEESALESTGSLLSKVLGEGQEDSLTTLGVTPPSFCHSAPSPSFNQDVQGLPWWPVVEWDSMLPQLGALAKALIRGTEIPRAFWPKSPLGLQIHPQQIKSFHQTAAVRTA